MSAVQAMVESVIYPIMPTDLTLMERVNQWRQPPQEAPEDAQERLEARASEDGCLLADTEVPHGVLVRSDAGVVLTASEDGWLRAFGCE